MIERSNPMAEELPAPFEAEMDGDNYILHTLSSPYTSMQQIGDCFLNEVDAKVANQTYARNMDIRKVAVHKDDIEKMMSEGQIFDSSTHSVIYNQINAIKNNPTQVNSDTLGRAKEYFKDLIAENPSVEMALEHTFDFNLPTAEAARIMVNMTPSLASKVINERAEKSAEMEYLKPANILERAGHYISADALMKDLGNVPAHKTSVIKTDLRIDGKSYSAELFLEHTPFFVGTPDEGDISLSIEAIAIYDSNAPGQEGFACMISGDDARALQKGIFAENDTLEQTAMSYCVNTSPELQDITKRYQEAHPDSTVTLSKSLSR